MTRIYLAVALMAAVLYPFSWWFVLGKDAMLQLYTDTSDALIMTVSIVTGSIIGIVVGRRVAQNVPPMLKGLIVRFGGALVGAQVPTFVLLAVLYIGSGIAPTVAGWWNIQWVSMVPLFVTYWLVHLLIEQLAPSIFGD